MDSTGQPESPTSSSLLQRVKADDPAAWRRLTELYGPLVFHWCRRHSVSPQDAGDVFQEVFAAVAAGIQGFVHDRQRGTFRGWLWTITRNKIRDLHRQRAGKADAAGGTHAQRQLAEIPEQLSDDASLEEADRQEINALFQRGLELVRGEFEDRTWQAFWRAAVEGQETAAIAADLGMSAGAVRQAKSRVLRRLRQELGDLAE